MFISFEGCEGSGKSTQIQLLSKYLSSKGIKHVVSREPGGSAIAEKIRSIILDKENGAMSDECEALLYAAARAQHLKEIIVPALERGEVVLCDRYVHSSLAYQGAARGLGEKLVREVNSFAFEKHMPDVTVFYDISPEEAFKRKNGADENDRLEQAGLEFHNAVYSGYKSLAERGEMVAVDAHGSIEEIFERTLDALKKAGVLCRESEK